jgi:hypothetical protein
MLERKRMSLVAILLTVCSAWSVTALADDRMDQLVAELGLFDDQIPQVEAVFAEARANRSAQRDSDSIAERGAARAQIREKLALILTAEQMETLDALHAERRAAGRERGRRGKNRGDTDSI